MTPAPLNARVVTARLAWVREMLDRIRRLPLDIRQHPERIAGGPPEA